MTADLQIQIHARPIQRGQDFGPSSSSARVSNTAELNLAWHFLDSCCKHADRYAISTADSSWTYAQLKELAIEVASSIGEHPSFRPQTRIGLHLANSIEYVAGYYGVLLAGGVAVPIPASCSKSQKESLLQLADVAMVIEAGRPESKPGSSSSLPVDFNREIRRQNDSDHLCDPDSVAMLMFTSGSSGKPKAVMLSHRNLIANSQSILGFLPIRKQDRALAVSPFSHALGNSVLQTHLLAGAELTIPESSRFTADIVAACVQRQCTSLTAVPEVIAGVAKYLEQKTIPGLRYMAVAGGKLDPRIATDVQKRIGHNKLYLMYGQTEATARIAWLPPRYLVTHPDSIGIPISGVQLKVADELGRPLPPGSVGTLFAKGDNIMVGYFNDVEATRAVVQDGWLNTGDLARLESNGLIKLCGRRNGLVKIMGHRFHPLEIESALASELNETQIVATPFDFYGNTRIALFARPDPGRKLDESKLKAICRKLLPEHMMPQRFQIVARWPLNAAGKVSRVELAASVNQTKRC